MDSQADISADISRAIESDVSPSHLVTRAGAEHDAPLGTAQSPDAQAWVSPGVSLRKRVLTGVGVALASALFFAIARHEGASSLVSTIIGIVFIGGFIGYLRVIAPTPFTLTLDAHGITRAEQGAEPVSIPWDQVAKVKQERFPKGKPVSIALFKRVGAKGLHRAWVVYGDDIPRFDEFVVALRAALPESTPWFIETVHE